VRGDDGAPERGACASKSGLFVDDRRSDLDESVVFVEESGSSIEKRRSRRDDRGCWN
jgi:hypothetical protein